MELELTDSSLNVERSLVTNADLHKAWNLLSLLLQLGRPAPPAELASRCVLFPASPEFIEYICSIPNSPLRLTNQWLVMPSLDAFIAFEKLMSNLNGVEFVVPRLEIQGSRPKRIWEDFVTSYYRKRKRVVSDFGWSLVAKGTSFHHEQENEENGLSLLCSSGDQRECKKVHFSTDCFVDKSNNAWKKNLFSEFVGKGSYSFEFDAGALNCRLKNSEHERSPHYQSSFWNFEIFSSISQPLTYQKLRVLMPSTELALLTTSVNDQVMGTEARMNCLNYESKERPSVLTTAAVKEQNETSLLDAEDIGHACNVRRTIQDVGGGDAEGRADEPLLDPICHEEEMECMVRSTFSSAESLPLCDNKTSNAIKCAEIVPVLLTRKETEGEKCQNLLSEPRNAQNHDEKLTGTTATCKGSKRVPGNQGEESSSKASGNSKAIGFPLDQPQLVQDKSLNSSKQKLKTKSDQKKLANERGKNYKEKRGQPTVTASNNQTQPKLQPDFESFTIEEEEGSGGYGTVYKARRKNNAETVAIKYPHPNANRHHIHNELKMLGRFGGKNYIIKCEGSFNAGSSECLVLEHSEHDRPEVLKREINMYELQWFSYCMFRALSGLHKQGVVHRDVKPGNFLFSREANKGYLIDFNLAMDLHQKYGTTDKSNASYDMAVSSASLPHARSLPPTNQKFNPRRSLLAMSQEAGKGSNPPLLQKNLKRKAMECTTSYPNLGGRKVMKSQGADGSGITSAKDATSTRTPSQERFREPIPCQGRKELISLAHKAMQTPNEEAQSVSAPKRKRIAALPGSGDRIIARLTPMPLHSPLGAGPLKNKGDGKQKREGPCVGTKGFRAPEVLLRSPHQGPKMDIWSAGVTLLYLMIGRSPFTGEPEQNIREIAKLRGSEDIWEVAKLHNRESSFPVDLLDVQHMQSTKLRDWCRQNTKRPDFFKNIPRSLFDLVDKCLTVNPRSRISADEALRHEFFDPCYEALKKGRLQRKEVGFDSEATRGLTTVSEPCKAFV